MAEQEIRVPVLKRLAEQAMADPDFRAVARVDLDRALSQYGYVLNAGELALVLRFRDTLEEAGVDLFLTPELGPELDRLFDADDPGGFDRLLGSRGTGS